MGNSLWPWCGSVGQATRQPHGQTFRRVEVVWRTLSGAKRRLLDVGALRIPPAVHRDRTEGFRCFKHGSSSGWCLLGRRAMRGLHASGLEPRPSGMGVVGGIGRDVALFDADQHMGRHRVVDVGRRSHDSADQSRYLVDPTWAI